MAVLLFYIKTQVKQVFKLICSSYMPFILSDNHISCKKEYKNVFYQKYFHNFTTLKRLLGH